MHHTSTGPFFPSNINRQTLPTFGFLGYLIPHRLQYCSCYLQPFCSGTTVLTGAWGRGRLESWCVFSQEARWDNHVTLPAPGLSALHRNITNKGQKASTMGHQAHFLLLGVITVLSSYPYFLARLTALRDFPYCNAGNRKVLRKVGPDCFPL